MENRQLQLYSIMKNLQIDRKGNNMNKKAFTVVELIASFALTMIISVFLFEVLLDVKDIYVETAVKTSIQQKIGIISKNIKKNLTHPFGCMRFNHICISIEPTLFLKCAIRYQSKIQQKINLQFNYFLRS